MSRFQPNLDALSAKKWAKFLERLKKTDYSDSPNVGATEPEYHRLVGLVEYIVNVADSAKPFSDYINPDIQNLTTAFESRMLQLQKSQPNQLQNILISLNNDATMILERIAPFVANADSARAAGQAYGRLRREAEAEKEKLTEIRMASETALASIQAVNAEIESFGRELLGDPANESGLKGRIEAANRHIEEMLSTTEVFYKKLTEGDAGSASIQNEIETALTDALVKSEEISDHLSDSDEKIRELEKIHNEVFGTTDEAGEFRGGLEGKLKESDSRLNELAKKFDQKANGLVEQIESLLPGATSAGLATAYKELKDTAETREVRYSTAFYFGIVLLTISAAITVTESFSFSPFQWSSIQISGVQEYLNKLLFKLPIVVPVLWFTVTVSKRRSEMHRLAEEYAHKEALAKSYEGFKKEIVELQRKDDPLLAELIGSILKAISVNAAKTLEGKHGEKMPMQELLEEASVSALKSK